MSGRGGRAPGAVAAVVVLLVVLAGCSTLSADVNTTDALRNAGYQAVKIDLPTGGGNTLGVSVTVAAQPAAGDEADVAHIVWQQFHERFDFLDITVHGQGSTERQSFTFDQVQAVFGPRNPAWNARSISSSEETLGIWVVVIFVVVVLGVIALVVGLRRRRRRRGPPAWPPGPPGWPGGPPGWPGGPPGWPGGGYPGQGGYPQPYPGQPGHPQPYPGQPVYPPPPEPPSERPGWGSPPGAGGR